MAQALLTVRSALAHALAHQLAKQEGRTVSDVLEDALEAYAASRGYVIPLKPTSKL
jgi:hypothetical protein